MKTFIVIVLLIASITIIAAVLMQESKSDGVASLTSVETNIAGKGGKKSKDAVLSQITIGASIVFFISAIVLAAIK